MSIRSVGSDNETRSLIDENVTTGRVSKRSIRMQMADERAQQHPRKQSTTPRGIHNTKAGFQFSYANSPLSSIRWNSFSERTRVYAFEFASRAARNGKDRVPFENRVTDSAGIAKYTGCIGNIIISARDEVCIDH